MHGCAAVCSRLSPGGAFAMPTLLHVAASARLFLDAWHTLPCLGLILIAWRAWFDLAAFWISGIHARALAAFGRLTFVGCFDAGCRAFHCAVSAPWCQKMPQGGPIAARYSLRKEQSGVRDGSHHDKSGVCKIVCVSPLKGQRLRRRSSPAQGAGHATMAAAWPAADWRRP